MKVLEVDVDTLRDTVMGVGAMAVCMAPLGLYSTEGKRASLMAEADKITAVEMAPAKAVEKMIECGMTPQDSGSA